MAAAVRTHATDRGVDWRGMPLFAFGGAGPVHACEVAALLQSSEVIVPPQPSVLSAFGTLVTSVRLDLVRSDLVRVNELDWTRVDRILGELAQRGHSGLEGGGLRRRHRHFDLRRRSALSRPAERTDRRARRRSAHATMTRAASSTCSRRPTRSSTASIRLTSRSNWSLGG